MITIKKKYFAEIMSLHEENLITLNNNVVDPSASKKKSYIIFLKFAFFIPWK